MPAMNSRKGRGACVFPFPFAPPDLREHVQTSPFRALEQVRTGQITIVTGVMTS